MDRSTWLKKGFIKDELPVWSCPNCGLGNLNLEDNFSLKPSAKCQSISDFYIDAEGREVPIDVDNLIGIESRFIGFLRCGNEKCKEYVAFSGLVISDNHVSEDENGLWMDVRDFYYPQSFCPTIHIIDMRKEYPDVIKNELINSFKLFWVDDYSCGNRIRSIIEILLNLFKIPSKKKNRKNKFERITLHKRIENYASKHPESGDILLAIKWIGNSSSHLNKLTRKQILDAYELLDLVLKKVFFDREKELVSLSKRINKKRKPI